MGKGSEPEKGRDFKKWGAGYDKIKKDEKSYRCLNCGSELKKTSDKTLYNYAKVNKKSFLCTCCGAVINMEVLV